MKARLIEAIREFRDQSTAPRSSWVRSYQASTPSNKHQFVLFLKPELTLNRELNLDGALEIVLEECDRWKVEIGAVRLLNGAYLKQYRIMDGHYGVLNHISHEGRPYISQEAEQKLSKEFAAQLREGAEVLGGHQFLERHRAISPLALTVLSDNLGGVKLAGGTYAIYAHVQGASYIILNAFHPYQLEPFYDDKNVLVVVEGISSTPWTDLRSRLAGVTNPAKTEPGSIRNRFLQEKESLALPDVSPGANGIHLSAGPLEGMVEVCRFFADHEHDVAFPESNTHFGMLLTSLGATADQIQEWASNVNLVREGLPHSAFDMTEEIDAESAAHLLIECTGVVNGA